MTYHLTLPQGLITFRNGMYQGSNTQAVWSPCNPNEAGGWQNGDILIVSCSFNLNPSMPTPPPAREYAGLCAGACNATNQTAVTGLINQAKGLPFSTPGRLLGSGITTSATAAATNLFYNATSVTGTFPLRPASRGTLTNYVYQWTMTYNGSNTVANGNTVEIVFGYGDPMDSEVDS
jgi:hypothetical protein